MRYFVDCEFDGHNGPLLSIALVREDGTAMYITTDEVPIDTWVLENVWPGIKNDINTPNVASVHNVPTDRVGGYLLAWLRFDNHPEIIADSAVDICRVTGALTTADDGTWRSLGFPMMIFTVRNVDCYPTQVEGAIQHNAYWDAMALRDILRR